jgi:hypothetical protein
MQPKTLSADRNEFSTLGVFLFVLFSRALVAHTRRGQLQMWTHEQRWISGATSTSIPGATSTSVPGATSTSVPGATSFFAAHAPVIPAVVDAAIDDGERVAVAVVLTELRGEEVRTACEPRRYGAGY